MIHGGTGTAERGQMTTAAESAYRAGLELAMQAAEVVLNANGSAVNAVEAGLKVLEDRAPDGGSRAASVMDGDTLKSGAVVDVRRTKNAISLAKAVMWRSKQAALVGAAADEFAASSGLAQADPAATSQHAVSLPSAEIAGGMVVRDRMGNLAAGTTAAHAHALPGAEAIEVIGAESYASNRSCAVAATGDGEAILRLTVAHSLCALVQYTGMDLQQAADEVVRHQMKAQARAGGVIAITPDGQIAWSFNTPQMFRARAVEGGPERTSVYPDEP
jgi:beta-aspartyl-peptidase (threonine type)